MPLEGVRLCDLPAHVLVDQIALGGPELLMERRVSQIALFNQRLLVLIHLTQQVPGQLCFVIRSAFHHARV